MSDKMKLIMKIVAVSAAVLSAIAGAIVIWKVICDKKNEKKKDLETIEEEAFSDFEECCDACFSEYEED